MNLKKSEAEAFLRRDGYAPISTAKAPNGAPGSRQEVEIWRKGAEFRLILTQFVAGRESFSQLFVEGFAPEAPAAEEPKRRRASA